MTNARTQELAALRRRPRPPRASWPAIPALVQRGDGRAAERGRPEKVRVDVKEALALAEAAELIARKLRSPEALAQGLRAKGNALYVLNDYRGGGRAPRGGGAAVREGRASRTRSAARSAPRSSRSSCSASTSARWRRRRARARSSPRQGDDLRLARLELNVGNIYHRQDRFAEALRSYEQAYERLLPRRNVEGIAVALGNMAMCLISLNDFPRALETHQRARAFCEQHGMPQPGRARRLQHRLPLLLPRPVRPRHRGAQGHARGLPGSWATPISPRCASSTWPRSTSS